MTEVQTQIAELTKKLVALAKADETNAHHDLCNQINDLREIEELEKELVAAAKDGDTITAYTLANKINDLKEVVTA